MHQMNGKESSIPDAWLQWLAVRILYNMLTWVFNRQTRVSHGDSVECSIIIPPVLIPVSIIHQVKGMS